MSPEIAYCPFCCSELSFESFEHMTNHRVYLPCDCKIYKRQCSQEKVKIDSEGFCLEPLKLRGRFLIKRPT